MIIRLIGFLRGSVLLLVHGQFVERFINLCLHRGIFLWDIRKNNETDTRLKMSVRAFKSLRPIARKTHTRVKILEKHGLPIWLAKCKRRTGFLIGILAAAIFFFVASLFVWTVEIAPTERTDESEIRYVLSELGVRPGALKSRIAPREIKDKALLKLDGLSWLWVDVRGVRVEVRLLEKRPAPEILSTDACDIVAARDGIICEIIATEGQTKVQVGDTVLRKQLLISAVFTSEREGVPARYTHASGQVFARTWYEASITIDAKQTIKNYTDRTHTHRRLKIGNFILPLGSQKNIPFEMCDLKSTSHDWLIFSKYTGISYQTDVYMEYAPETRERSAAEMKAEAEKELDAEIGKMIFDKSAERIDARTKVTPNGDGTFTITRTAEYKEQIGEQVVVR